MASSFSINNFLATRSSIGLRGCCLSRSATRSKSMSSGVHAQTPRLYTFGQHESNSAPNLLTSATQDSSASRRTVLSRYVLNSLSLVPFISSALILPTWPKLPPCCLTIASRDSMSLRGSQRRSGNLGGRGLADGRGGDVHRIFLAPFDHPYEAVDTSLVSQAGGNDIQQIATQVVLPLNLRRDRFFKLVDDEVATGLVREGRALLEGVYELSLVHRRLLACAIDSYSLQKCASTLVYPRHVHRVFIAPFDQLYESVDTSLVSQARGNDIQQFAYPALFRSNLRLDRFFKLVDDEVATGLVREGRALLERCDKIKLELPGSAVDHGLR